jgi:hypothetical protein
MMAIATFEFLGGTCLRIEFILSREVTLPKVFVFKDVDVVPSTCFLVSVCNNEFKHKHSSTR